MNATKLRLVDDSEDREIRRMHARTPIAAALLNEGHDALNRCLDEGLRERILNTLVVVGYTIGVGRDMSEEEAATVRRLFAQVQR